SRNTDISTGRTASGCRPPAAPGPRPPPQPSPACGGGSFLAQSARRWRGGLPSPASGGGLGWGLIALLYQPQSKTRLDQLREGTGAVADPVLMLGIDFAEGLIVSIRHKYGVVAEAALAARRPGQPTVYLAAKCLDRAVRPGQRQHRDEIRAPVLLAELAMDPLHRDAEVFCRAGPARRIDAGRAIERRDDQPGIIGESRQTTRLGGGTRLQFGVGFECRAGLLGLG